MNSKIRFISEVVRACRSRWTTSRYHSMRSSSCRQGHPMRGRDEHIADVHSTDAVTHERQFISASSKHNSRTLGFAASLRRCEPRRTGKNKVRAYPPHSPRRDLTHPAPKRHVARDRREPQPRQNDAGLGPDRCRVVLRRGEAIGGRRIGRTRVCPGGGAQEGARSFESPSENGRSVLGTGLRFRHTGVRPKVGRSEASALARTRAQHRMLERGDHNICGRCDV